MTKKKMMIAALAALLLAVPAIVESKQGKSSKGLQSFTTNR